MKVNKYKTCAQCPYYHELDLTFAECLKHKWYIDKRKARIKRLCGS